MLPHLNVQPESPCFEFLPREKSVLATCLTVEYHQKSCWVFERMRFDRVYIYPMVDQICGTVCNLVWRGYVVDGGDPTSTSRAHHWAWKAIAFASSIICIFLFSSYYPCSSFYSLQTNVNGWKTVLFIVVTAWLGILVACIIVLFTICSERERERAQTLSVFKMYNYSGSWCLPYVTIRGGWSTLFDFVYEHMQHCNIIYICSHSFFSIYLSLWFICYILVQSSIIYLATKSAHVHT